MKYLLINESEKGMSKGKLEVAINLIAQGFDNHMIEQVTRPSNEQIQELRK